MNTTNASKCRVCGRDTSRAISHHYTLNKSGFVMGCQHTEQIVLPASLKYIALDYKIPEER